MDELERRLERIGGAGVAEAHVEPDAAADAQKAAAASVEPGAATELALEPGEKPVYDGAAGEEKLAQDGAAAGVEEPARYEAITRTKEPTSVGLSVKTEKQARVGFAKAEEPARGGAAAGRMEPEEAAGEAGGSEAEWRRRAEGYALRAVFSEARAAAAAMGVPENRLDHVARLSDLSGIDPEDKAARDRIAEAVRAVLRELPEIRGGVGTGQATAPRRPRRDAFEQGFLGK